MKYSIGDNILLKENLIPRERYGSAFFEEEMNRLKKAESVIVEVHTKNGYYITKDGWYITDEMINRKKKESKKRANMRYRVGDIVFLRDNLLEEVDDYDYTNVYRYIGLAVEIEEVTGTYYTLKGVDSTFTDYTINHRKVEEYKGVG